MIRTRLALASLILTIGRVRIIGRMLRWLARSLPDGLRIRIPFGGNAGFLWRHRSADVSGYWLGNYEPEMQQALIRWLRPGQRMFDVGAHAGFFTLLAARRVGRHGAVLAFEPQPVLAGSIRERAAMNRLKQVRVLPVAAGAASGCATLAVGSEGSSMARVSAVNALHPTGVRVPVMSLDGVAALHGVPDLVKMDIEGAEEAALQGAPRLLAERRTIWVIETHGNELNRRVRHVLQAAGYRLMDLAGRPLAQGAMDYPHVVGLPPTSGEPSASV